MKVLKNIARVTIPTLLVLFLVLEIFFRVVIPASNPPRGHFDEEEGIYSLSKSKTSGLFTEGRFASVQGRWRINNMGWNYSIDYDTSLTDDLIAVIGDSYIEGFHVNVDQNYPYLLRQQLLGQYEVYAFGKSGSPLSQYLHLSRYVNRHFNPQVLIINVVYNDFNESMIQSNPDDIQFLRLDMADENSPKEVAPVPNPSLAQYTRWKRIAYKSALFRYLHLNLKITSLNLKPKRNDRRFRGNIDIEEANRSMAKISKSAEYMLKALRNENPEKRIIIVMDTDREALYHGEQPADALNKLNQMMHTICNRYGIELVDLTQPMKEEFARNRLRFDFGPGQHWNQHAHELIAKLLVNTKFKN